VKKISIYAVAFWYFLIHPYLGFNFGIAATVVGPFGTQGVCESVRSDLTSRTSDCWSDDVERPTVRR
jgi:hypothetical protein